MPVIGAIQETLKGPGTLTHEGGDPILIAPVEDGLAGTEHTLIFEGEEKVIDGDDEFKPADPKDRSIEIGGASLIRSLGQANYEFKKTQKTKEAVKSAT